MKKIIQKIRAWLLPRPWKQCGPGCFEGVYYRIMRGQPCPWCTRSGLCTKHEKE